MAKKIDFIQKKTEDSIKTTHETRLLKCELTPEEVSAAADAMARTLDDKEAIEDEFKTVKADFKAQIEAKEAEAKVLRNLVRNKYAHRQTPCTMVLNYTTQTVVVTRDDTEAIVVDRPMVYAEKQMDLGFDAAEEEKPE